MAPYIFGKRNGIHIIDVRETVRGLIIACEFLRQLGRQDPIVLFVGTKRQAREVVRREALRAGMCYVNERWIGGLLTNYNIVRKSCDRLIEIERMFETGEVERLTKKELASLQRERRKLTRTLEGVKNMKRLPDALIVIDAHHEENALKEAKRLGIVSISLTDTDSDPEASTICIPGNDDSMRAIDLICTKLTDALLEGRQQALGRIERMRGEGEQEGEKAEAEQQEQREEAEPEAQTATQGESAE